MATERSKGSTTRQAILHEGVVTAYRVGLGGLTIGRLAAATGLSKSGLYAHFGSKEDLQLAVLARAAEEFSTAVVVPALRQPRGEPRLRALFENWLDSGIARAPGGCLFVKARTELDEQPGPVRDQLVRDHRRLYDSLTRIVQTGIDEGHLRADTDPVQLAADLDGIMLAFYHWHRLLEDPQAESRARTAFERLLDHVRAEEER